MKGSSFYVTDKAKHSRIAEPFPNNRSSVDQCGDPLSREVVLPIDGDPGRHRIPRDAPGSIACGRRALPLLAICPSGHRRTVPFRLLKTSDTDRSPLYGRPFKCGRVVALR